MTIDKQHKAIEDWSETVKAELVPDGGIWVKLAADENQRRAISGRLGVVSIDGLTAKVHLKPKNKGHIIHVEGTLQADVTQECVASLELIEFHIEDCFEAWFADYDKAASFSKARHERKGRMEMEELQIMEEEEDPEPMINGAIDVAELVVQYLSLAINPYPKNDSGKSEGGEAQKQANSGALRPNPFAALKNWRPQD